MRTTHPLVSPKELSGFGQAGQVNLISDPREKINNDF